MATHSSIVAWRIPWTKEPGGLQSMGLQEPDTTQPLNFQESIQFRQVSGFSLLLGLILMARVHGFFIDSQAPIESFGRSQVCLEIRPGQSTVLAFRKLSVQWRGQLVNRKLQITVISDIIKACPQRGRSTQECRLRLGFLEVGASDKFLIFRQCSQEKPVREQGKGDRGRDPKR